MLEGRRYVVSGRVQGVGFRFFVREAAQREGIAGSVWNRDDGCVEAAPAHRTEEARALCQGGDLGERQHERDHEQRDHASATNPRHDAPSKVG